MATTFQPPSLCSMRKDRKIIEVRSESLILVEVRKHLLNISLYKVKAVHRIDDETFLIGFTVDLCRLKFEN